MVRGVIANGVGCETAQEQAGGGLPGHVDLDGQSGDPV